MVFGTMGGDGQPQTHLQVYTAVEKFGLNMQQALEMPRWVHGGTYQTNEETLLVENRFPAETVAGLRQLGHIVQEGNSWLSTMGYAQGIMFDQENGVMHGGSDPRAEGIAAGW
jgi:gamma-glutamyltranspeptidase/glutathione hydrolase